MAQVKISALTAADPLTGVEEAPFVQGGATKKATPEQIRAYVESQPNVFSVTQTIEDTAPALRFSENDTVDQNWEFIGVAGALRLDELNDLFATTGTHHTFTHGGGTQFGAPAGGDQGAGTVNAQGVSVNGDPVLQDADLAANGGLVPTTDRTNTFTPAQVFSAAPTATGHPLRFDELAENGGSVPEADRANTFTATQTLESAAPELRLSETDTTDDNWAIKADASLFKVEEQDDLFATTGTHTTLTHGGGMQVGAPTGGDQGAGTVNATGLFENGTGVAKLSGGADANFTAMPQVGGDPIVESDSNADGEFTRFADGTQHSATFQPASSSGFTQYSHPASFTSAPKMLGSPFNSSSDTLLNVKYNNVTSTTFEIAVAAQSSTGHLSFLSHTPSTYMSGRWK